MKNPLKKYPPYTIQNRAGIAWARGRNEIYVTRESSTTPSEWERKPFSANCKPFFLQPSMLTKDEWFASDRDEP